MTEVIIRQYEQADLESCRSLWEELTQRHRDICEDQTIGGKEPGMHFDKHLSRVGEENIWVAEHDGQVVGMVGLILEDEEEVEPIVVASEHRNKGIGSRLLERAIEKSRELWVTLPQHKTSCQEFRGDIALPQNRIQVTWPHRIGDGSATRARDKMEAWAQYVRSFPPTLSKRMPPESYGTIFRVRQ